jgi:phosphate starvation-inducible PhoH-like protein
LVTKVLSDIDDIHFARLTSQDVVRHTLVGRIVDAYTKYDSERQARQFERRSERSGLEVEGARTPADFRPPQNRAERRGHEGARDGARGNIRDFRKDH